MADQKSDDSLYPIAVLIDELKNEDIQVGRVPEARRLFAAYFANPKGNIDFNFNQP
jgi:hypothetical protein